MTPFADMLGRDTRVHAEFRVDRFHQVGKLVVGDTERRTITPFLVYLPA